MRQPRQLTLPQVLSQTSNNIALLVHGQQVVLESVAIGRRPRGKGGNVIYYQRVAVGEKQVLVVFAGDDR